MKGILIVALASVALIHLPMVHSQQIWGRQVEIVLLPQGENLITDTLQHAINYCASKGGGLVRLVNGTYRAGTIILKSNVTLYLEKGAILQGSAHYSDYDSTRDAFLFARGEHNIAIEGEGVIDGVNCYNPDGEEGFRGPHLLKLIKCSGIKIHGISIVNAANYAIYCRECSYGIINKIQIRGGHDGLHTRFCDSFKVTSCDIRTGDDAFAGNDNRNFLISDCKINSSCNGFRIGCYNFIVRRCSIWGPGEYMHKIQRRNNMLSAFVHFSPSDENPRLISGNWRIEDVTIKNVDNVYVYNFRDGLWQTGRPVTNIIFDNLKATDIGKVFTIVGDTNRLFNMEVRHSEFSFRECSQDIVRVFEGAEILSPAIVNLANFNKIVFKEVTFRKEGDFPFFIAENGNVIILKETQFFPDCKPNDCVLTNIKRFKAPMRILKMRQLPQGPLSLRFSGICPDASVQGQRTAHQFASLLMRNPGLIRIAHESIRNVPVGPLSLRFSGICPDASV